MKKRLFQKIQHLFYIFGNVLNCGMKALLGMKTFIFKFYIFSAKNGILLIGHAFGHHRFFSI